MFKKITATILSLLLLTGCTQTDVDNNKNKKEAGKTAVPELTLADYSGNKINIAELNKLAVINSWAGWCGFCKEELKDFTQVQEELGSEIKIIAINRAENKEKAKGYTDDLNVTEDLIFLLDPKDRFYKQIGGFAMPETILVNKNGEVVFHKRGPMDAQELKQKIDKHLLN